MDAIQHRTWPAFAAVAVLALVGGGCGHPTNSAQTTSSATSSVAPSPIRPPARYNDYGEVPIPGKQTLHLPAGKVGIFFHATTPVSGDGDLAIPEINLDFDPPDPQITESIGGTTSIDNDAWRRIAVAQIPREGDYQITTDGKVTAFVSAAAAFGPPDAN